MPLPVLLALVVLGVGGIAVALHLLGLSAPRRLDEAGARAAWLREFPGDTVTAATVCADGSAALIAAHSGPGVVWTMGADTTARPLHGARSTAQGNGLTLHLPDFTAPRLQLRLTPQEADLWTRTLKDTA